MAPRRRRPKVGLTRMHSALDAMRPIGLSPVVVRKCVKDLLKVYGDDGWAFIEDATYKLLIDTILEEPESVPEICDKEVVFEEKICALDFHCENINIGGGKSQEQDLAVEVTPVLSQGDVKARCEVVLQLGFAPSPHLLHNLRIVFQGVVSPNHVVDGLVMTETMIMEFNSS